MITTIVFFLLFASRNFLVFEKKIESAKEEVHQNLHLQVRLEHLFSQILPSSFLSQGMPPLYTTFFPKEKELSLVLIFDNGLDPDPKFSGPVLGRIFLTKEELHLIVWPLEKDGSIANVWREEKLLSNVEKASFAFFSAAKEEEHPSFQWYSQWPEERKEAPLMIRLSIEKKGKKAFFAFLPPISSTPIVYKKEAR